MHSIINRHEQKVISQFGDDGIIQYIFSVIGTRSKCFVEFGVGPRECNTGNLVIHHGWRGLMMDGDDASLYGAKQFYHAALGRDALYLRFIKAWITRENINDLIKSSGIRGEIDLLSIDVDGNDYWIWQAIDCIDPRIVIIEYNASMGPMRSVSIPYDPDFDRMAVPMPATGVYCGASLTALTKLGTQKGYKLIGCNTAGNNAFYLRRDIAGFPELSPAIAFYPPVYREGPIEDTWKRMEYMEFVEIK